jgi:hypothetical protein
VNAKNLPHLAPVLAKPEARRELTTRFLDFWLLGGASIVVWFAMMIGEQFRQNHATVQQHFLQVAATFSLLSLVCNHPHFMISYRMGYGRGWPFVFRHWFALLLVPALLVLLFAAAFFSFQINIDQIPSIVFLNETLAKTGTSFRVGLLPNLGTELLSLSVWLMYLTVGWHYSKQVFGCIMVYSHFDRYHFKPWQKNLLKLNLYSIALFSFFYLNIYWQNTSHIPGQTQFFNVPIMTLGLPEQILVWAGGFVALCSIGCLAGIFLRNYLRNKELPSVNLLVPWVAFHIWWIPLVYQKEFYFMMVPFFHSLQYLPFSYRMELGKVKKNAFFHTNLSLRILTLLIIGFLAFEQVPTWIDTWLDTKQHQSAMFFMVAFMVFINVHHFFIDSIAWRFDQADLRKNLL